jgi:DNA-binding MarR family transcriptional regulator
MKKEKIIQSFSKVKEDIIYLENQIFELKKEINDLKSNLSTTKQEKFFMDSSSTNNFVSSTQNIDSTDNPTVPQEIGGLKNENSNTSTGNRGDPTNKQTNSQTDKNTIITIEKDLEKASKILDSLYEIRKEIRSKFKKITSQEMVVFSAIYQLEEKTPSIVTYREIASILHLSESSIRDYVQRMISKGIPIKKEKLSNKRILLSISPELKKIASLSAIINLRDL